MKNQAVDVSLVISYFDLNDPEENGGPVYEQTLAMSFPPVQDGTKPFVNITIQVKGAENDIRVVEETKGDIIC